MALRDELESLLMAQRIARTPLGESTDRVLDLVLRHRDELLAPDESVRRDGEMRARDGKVWEQTDDMHRGDLVLVYMVPVSDAEPSGEDDRHG